MKVLFEIFNQIVFFLRLSDIIVLYQYKCKQTKVFAENKTFTPSKNLELHRTLDIEVTGDKKVGEVVVNIHNTLEGKVLFSKSFTTEQELEALDVISEAKDLVLEANNEINRQYIDQKIEAEGFVDRMISHGTI